MRRKFDETARAHDSPLAQEALVRIRALYTIEEEIRGQRPALRREQRQARAGPLLEELYQWFICRILYPTDFGELWEPYPIRSRQHRQALSGSGGIGWGESTLAQ